MPSLMADILTLIDTEIPEGRQSLQDSFVNLEKVAEYCESNYYLAQNKKTSLDETKNFTTQSLASVAYMINSLSYNILHILDLQTSQLAEMESQINHIAQTVNIFKEKVARREIGVLTTNKNTTRHHKILAPANQERPVKYIRKPVDYQILDDIGHGVKTTSNTPRSKRTVTPVQNTLNGASAGPAPTTKPPTPPQPVRAASGTLSLSRSNKEYRTPHLPIAPPQVPSNYAPAGVLRSQDIRRGSGYSTLPMVSSSQAPQSMIASQPPVGMVHPMTTLGQSSVPPPPDMNMNDKLPEPPMHVSSNFENPGNISPPLPPPPPDDDSYQENYNPPSPPSFMRRAEWVPKNFVEKVVAIYDYCADKEDELSFSENTIIYVMKKNDDGWYEGVMMDEAGGAVAGLFPGNYVEPCL
ncbi:abl interactor 2 isoform X2 [Parasteatoda tepidariorum]|nr:abl interactor 1 isoform X1 [Parasteatoda tepidariorum]XP_015906360.1 abl interactor 1 isoform X1 [Parasteatoda tepidariorum]XP_042900597.1 abl interactor 1 isoform X1 [Parasteatoda tepidariorum]